MSCFPKKRPEFDLEIYDYLIEKGYLSILRLYPDKDCYLLLGDKNQIVITPYKPTRLIQEPYYINYDLLYLPIINIFLCITKDGCYLRLFFDEIYDDCLKDIVLTIVARSLYELKHFFEFDSASAAEDLLRTEYNLYDLKLKVSDWKTAIDYFYNVIVPIIDDTLRRLKLRYPECQEVIDKLKITDEEFKEEVLTFKDAVEDCRTKLRNKLTQRRHPLNLILYGPPGTGKTYNAISYAVAMIENLPINMILDEPRDEVLERYKEYLKNGQIVFTTFHPSYSYEDFIEGLKAKVNENGQVVYYVEDGIFKEIVKRAKDNPDRNYVIIIDEINRGNIPSIFGELITLIEEDKREGMPNAISVKLPYSKKDFSVPSNLYILGTMNTADRSIALLDIALRRRFEFEELMPRPDLLKDIKVVDDNNKPLDIGLEKLLECLNKRIEKNLDRNKTIGHTYFLSFVKEDPSGQKYLTLADLNKIFKNKIIPLLQEYFYDDWDKIRGVLNDKDTGYFIEKDRSCISSKLDELSLPAEAFINIYQNCENAGNN